MYMPTYYNSTMIMLTLLQKIVRTISITLIWFWRRLHRGVWWACWWAFLLATHFENLMPSLLFWELQLIWPWSCRVRSLIDCSECWQGKGGRLEVFGAWMLSTDCNSHFCPILPQLREWERAVVLTVAGTRMLGLTKLSFFPPEHFPRTELWPERWTCLFPTLPPSSPLLVCSEKQWAMWTLAREHCKLSTGRCLNGERGVGQWKGTVVKSIHGTGWCRAVRLKSGAWGGGSIISFVLILPIC